MGIKKHIFKVYGKREKKKKKPWTLMFLINPDFLRNAFLGWQKEWGTGRLCRRFLVDFNGYG